MLKIELIWDRPVTTVPHVSSATISAAKIAKSLPLPPCHRPQPLIGPFSRHKVGASRLYTLCMYVMCVCVLV